MGTPQNTQGTSRGHATSTNADPRKLGTRGRDRGWQAVLVSEPSSHPQRRCRPLRRAAAAPSLATGPMWVSPAISCVGAAQRACEGRLQCSRRAPESRAGQREELGGGSAADDRRELLATAHAGCRWPAWCWRPCATRCAVDRTWARVSASLPRLLQQRWVRPAKERQRGG